MVKKLMFVLSLHAGSYSSTRSFNSSPSFFLIFLRLWKWKTSFPPVFEVALMYTIDHQHPVFAEKIVIETTTTEAPPAECN